MSESLDTVAFVRIVWTTCKVWQGGVRGRGACVAGGAWQRGMHGRGVCIAGGKIYQLKNDHTRDFSLPPENEVWGKIIFSEAYVKNSVHQWGSTLAGIPPGSGTPLWARYTPIGTSPGTRYTPLAGTHTPQDQAPPVDTPPWPGTPPGAMHAGRYGQQAAGTHPTGMHSCF